MQSSLANLARFEVTEHWPGVPAIVSQTLFGIVCGCAIVLVRSLIDLVAPSAGPFALIYPATLIATLFGGWRAGIVTYALAFTWVWFFLLPHTATLQLARADDGPRTVVNALTVLVVLIFAAIFRAAVRSATVQRDVAIASLEDREARLRELNQNLEMQVADRIREFGQTWRVTPDLLGVLDTEGYFEASNPAWQEALGWPIEKIRTTRFFEFIHPDDLDRTHSAWDVAQRGEPVLRFENRYRTRDGRWKWLSWVVVPEGGKFYCSARDVTLAKEAEEELALAQESLRQAQKMEAIGQLTGGVAHDFNNLLTVIVGSAELLRRPDLSEQRRDRYVEAISETAQRAAKLTSQLLAFARRQTLRPELFDVEASLGSLVDIVRTLVGTRVTLEHRPAGESRLVMADRSQFDTAIVNMAVNARDAIEGDGRITISSSLIHGVPAVRSHPAMSGDFVAVTISDSGQGIAEENVARIFEPFFTTKQVGAGTGLGLSQVIGFAKQSDGEIRVDSALGEGTTFTLYLPRAEASAAAVIRPAEDSACRAGDGICVLVVEDNEYVGAFATSALRELGYDSVLAASGEDALEKLAEGCERYHVVFSDVVMPGMSGLDLGARIRQSYPGIQVVLASGYSHVLAEHGDHGFALIHKPYSIEQLAGALVRAVSLSAGTGASVTEGRAIS